MYQEESGNPVYDQVGSLSVVLGGQLSLDKGMLTASYPLQQQIRQNYFSEIYYCRPSFEDLACHQGCQMVLILSYQKSRLGYIFEGLGM
jgi:hypothetical protein